MHGHARLSAAHAKLIQEHEESGLGVCAISCWEVAKLAEKNRLELPIPVDDWMRLALGYPGITLLALEPGIAIESTRLPGAFHNASCLYTTKAPPCHDDFASFRHRFCRTTG